jgi:hypothetical protein
MKFNKEIDRFIQSKLLNLKIKEKKQEEPKKIDEIQNGNADTVLFKEFIHS